MICDGCGQEGASETLHLAAPLGSCCVRVHRDRECAELARAARGGGRFYVPGPTKEEKVAPARSSSVPIDIAAIRSAIPT